MVQATTPTFVLTLPESVDPSQFSKTVFSLSQDNLMINKTGNSLIIDGHTISVLLTQAETLKFVVGKAYLQLNWLYADGTRACSEIKEIEITPNLLREILKQ